MKWVPKQKKMRKKNLTLNNRIRVIIVRAEIVNT